MEKLAEGKFGDNSLNHFMELQYCSTKYKREKHNVYKKKLTILPQKLTSFLCFHYCFRNFGVFFMASGSHITEKYCWTLLIK